MPELRDTIIRQNKEADELEENEIRYRRETFWFNIIVWGLLATIPIGFIIAFAGALIVGMVFVCIGIGSMFIGVLMALFAIG